MRVDVLSLPHPVLGPGDDVDGIYEANPSGSITFGRDKISIPIVHSLDNKTMETLLANCGVAFCIEVNCPQTFYRKTFLRQALNDVIEIPSDKLRRKTNINFYIVATRDISRYTIDGANEDYEGFEFEIKKGDVLGYGGYASFYAEKDWAIKDTYRLMTVTEADNEEQKDFRVDLNHDDSIVVYLPKRDFDMYRQLQTGRFNRLFHSSIAVPVLMYTLYQIMEEGENSDMASTRWYQIIEDRKINENLEGKWSQDYVLELAQTLLAMPLTGTLEKCEVVFD